MRILVVEDSKRLQGYVARGLRNAGYAVDVADDGEEGLWLARSNAYDVIVLDLMLPKIDGIAVLERLRSEGNRTHVLVLTARDTVDDRVHGLQRGADDYLVKPFDFKELIARVQALARRGYGVKRPEIEIGELAIDTSARTVRVGSELVGLTPREYALLEYLALRRDEVVSRAEIESHIYDDQTEAMSNVVDSAIYHLRRKLNRGDGESFIETRRGMGYVLRNPAGDATECAGGGDDAS
jgi:two-component system OmpR family response regulator